MAHCPSGCRYWHRSDCEKIRNYKADDRNSDDHEHADFQTPSSSTKSNSLSILCVDPERDGKRLTLAA